MNLLYFSLFVHPIMLLMPTYKGGPHKTTCLIDEALGLNLNHILHVPVPCLCMVFFWRHILQCYRFSLRRIIITLHVLLLVKKTY